MGGQQLKRLSDRRTVEEGSYTRWAQLLTWTILKLRRPVTSLILMLKNGK